MYQTQDIGYLKLISNLVIKWVSNHSPVNKAIRTRIRYDLWRQWSSKCSERTRKSFGRNVLPMVWIHERLWLLYFGELTKRSLISCLVFTRFMYLNAPLLTILLGKTPITQLRKNWATITRHQPKMPCLPNKMANAGSSNLPWRPVLKAEKKN